MSLWESLGLNADEIATVDPKAVDAAMAAGGVAPEGKYHAVVTGYQSVESRDHSNTGAEIEYTILHGAFRDHKINDTLWNSDNEKAKQRKIIFAHRLGLMAPAASGKGYEPVPGKGGWVDALGTQCIIDVTIEEYEMKDKHTKQPTGKKGKANRLAFEGVFKLDDPRVKDVPRGDVAGITAAKSNGSAGGTNGTPKDDYAKLGI